MNKGRALAIGLVALAALPVYAREYYAESVKSLNERILSAVGPADASRIVIPFEVDPALASKARELTRNLGGTRERSRRVVEFMLGKGELALRYDRSRTRTAREVAENQTGNCLSLTNLYIGLARAASVNAKYVHVTEVNTFTEAEVSGGGAGVIVHSSHICAAIIEGTQVYLVDFSPSTTRQYRSYDLINDVEALAHYYNNRGYECAFKSGEGMGPELEIDSYETAIRVAPDFYPAYNNLGTAWRRRGDLGRALQLYARAIEINPRFAEAYSNRASVFLTMGKPEDAIAELQIAARLSPSNPYPFADLGNIYYALKRYAEAESSYEKAVSRAQNADFYVSLARARSAQGQRQRAMEALLKAQKLAPDDPEIARQLSAVREGGGT